ncbi:hypothetical protein ACLLKL_001966 [Escherichia coli]
MTAFAFMGDHPVLTFFLALLFCTLLRAAFRWSVILIYGYPPMWCDSEGRYRKDE